MSNNRGKLGATMKKSSGLPIKLRVIKVRKKFKLNLDKKKKKCYKKQ